MPKLKSISKTTNTVKLFIGDKLHIKEMVRENRHIDKRFETETSAIRYFVHLGISAQSSTENLNRSLDNTIVKDSIKEAVRKELTIHSDKIDKIENFFIEYIKRTESNFGDLARRSDTLENHLVSQKETIENQLQPAIETIVNFLKRGKITDEHALRNLIVLRSIFYVFFFGYRTGKIGAGTEDIKKWTRLIQVAHEKANKLSVDEINLLSSDVVESRVIMTMANDIFKEVNALPQPHIAS